MIHIASPRLLLLGYSTSTLRNNLASGEGAVIFRLPVPISAPFTLQHSAFADITKVKRKTVGQNGGGRAEEPA